MTARVRTRRRRSLASRRIRAILAAGVVLGIGGASTLAAWTDPEYTTATMTAGRFGIEGASGTAAFGEHATRGSAAQLAFDIPTNALAPGATAYSAFRVRTIDGSVAGTALLTADGGNEAGLGAYLRYGVSVVSGTTCSAATFASGTVIVPRGSTLTTSATQSQSLQAASGNTVTYCFAITLPPETGNAAQGTTLSATWNVQAQST